MRVTGDSKVEYNNCLPGFSANSCRRHKRAWFLLLLQHSSLAGVNKVLRDVAGVFCCVISLGVPVPSENMSHVYPFYHVRYNLIDGVLPVYINIFIRGVLCRWTLIVFRRKTDEVAAMIWNQGDSVNRGGVFQAILIYWSVCFST